MTNSAFDLDPATGAFGVLGGYCDLPSTDEEWASYDRYLADEMAAWDEAHADEWFDVDDFHALF